MGCSEAGIYETSKRIRTEEKSKRNSDSGTYKLFIDHAFAFSYHARHANSRSSVTARPCLLPACLLGLRGQLSFACARTLPLDSLCQEGWAFNLALRDADLGLGVDLIHVGQDWNLNHIRRGCL